MSTESDRQLLEAFAQAGDQRAFGVLVERYRALVYRVCRRILVDVHEAEDATQAVFVVLMKKASSLRKNGVLVSWLHAVARQTALYMARRRVHRSQREATAGELLASEGAEAPDEATQQALLGVLDRELAALSDRQREAVILRYLEGHSAEEAAAIAGCEVGALKVRASDGIARLRSRLARQSVALSVPALAAALTAEAQAAVPTTVLSSITGASTFAAANAAAGVAGVTGGGTVMSLANATMKAMFVAKVKAVAAVCAAAVVVGAGIPVAVTLAQGEAKPKAPPKLANGATTEAAASQRPEVLAAWTAEGRMGPAYDQATKLLGRNGFAVFQHKTQEQIFLERLKQAGIEVQVIKAQPMKGAPTPDYTNSMQVVCFRDVHTATAIWIFGAEEVAGGIGTRAQPSSRSTRRIALAVEEQEAARNVPAWKAYCAWIPRAARLKVPGPGKDEVWTADDKGRAVADGLQACLEVKQRQIKPGADITLTMSLRNVRPADGEPIRVWDNKYSEGYRADFYLVITPDGQSRILRRPVQPAWRKNVPTPISIEPGKSWTLAGIANDAIVKSLKSLGLDTTQPGIYTITGYYEADGPQGDRGDRARDFWGGQIATPPVEVEIKPDDAAARFLDAAKYAGFAAVAEVKVLPQAEQAGNAVKLSQLGIEWKELLYAPDAIRQALSVVNALTFPYTTAEELKIGDRILVVGDNVTRYVLPDGGTLKFEGQSPEVLPKNGGALLGDAQWLLWTKSRQDALQAALAPGWKGANCPWCTLFLNDDRRPPLSQRACQACNKLTALPDNEELCPSCAAQRGECWTCERTVGSATRDVTFRLWAFDPNAERDLMPRNECRIKPGAKNLPLWVEVQNEKGETPEFQTPGGGKRFDCCKTLFYLVEGPGLSVPTPTFHVDGGARATMMAPSALQKGSASIQVQLLTGNLFATPGTYTLRAVAGRLVSHPVKVIVDAAAGAPAETDAARQAKQQAERQAQIERERELKEKAIQDRAP